VQLYESHLVQTLEQITRTPFQFCDLIIKKNYENIDDYKFEDFEIVNYTNNSTIKAEMVA
jgi:thymidylate synthase